MPLILMISMGCCRGQVKREAHLPPFPRPLPSYEPKHRAKALLRLWGWAKAAGLILPGDPRWDALERLRAARGAERLSETVAPH